jgi:hypothetical protein
MKRFSFWFAFLLGLVCAIGLGTISWSADQAAVPRTSAAQTRPHTAQADTSNPSDQPGAASEAPSEEAGGSLKPFDIVVKDTQALEGLFNLYYNPEQSKLYAEIRPDQLNRDYFLVATLDSGLGEFGIYRGMPVQDFPFVLRRVYNTIQVVVPNFYFRSEPADTSQRFVSEFFSDSVLMTLPLLSLHEERGTLLVDLAPLLQSGAVTGNLNDVLGSISYSRDASKFLLGDVAAFPLNLELEAIYTLVGQPSDSFFGPITLPNASSFNLSVRYSISELPTDNGYQPRLADERVGYFITAYQDISKRQERDRFVRYLDRWHLEKQDPTAALSPPKQPIVFWIENTVPPEYREAIHQGILMWNRAFEKIGFHNAIEARQMPDDADWNPADVRYNTIRWTDSVDGGFALGPSRVNPFTGEILDADVLVDANFVRSAYDTYRVLVNSPESSESLTLLQRQWSRMTQNPALCNAGFTLTSLRNPNYRRALAATRQTQSPQILDRCYSLEATEQLSVGATALSLLDNVLPSSSDMENYVTQFLQQVVAHEVGHALGLRHNFRGSTLLSPEALQTASLQTDRALSGSVMDYLPVNLAPPGLEQGNYYAPVIGPYDEWAIEYGYKPLENLSLREQRQALDEIAQRAPDPELAYATDEDFWADLDPSVNVFDLSSDPLVYAKQQLDLSRKLWTKLAQRFPTAGESDTEARPVFGRVLNYYFSKALGLNSYIGGRSLNRYHQGDTVDRLPLEPIPAETQRKALNLLQDQVFNADAFQFPPNLASKLPPSRWFHWGSFPAVQNVEYPLVNQVLLLQTLILSNLFTAERLQRLRDTAFLYPDRETFSLTELFETLQQGIWIDTLKSNPASIPLLQRRLQHQYLVLLINLLDPLSLQNSSSLPDIVVAIFTYGAPEEAGSIARYELQQLGLELRKALGRSSKLDLESRSHLQDAYDRILQVLG